MGGGIGGEGLLEHWHELYAAMPLWLRLYAVFIFTEARVWDGGELAQLTKGPVDSASACFYKGRFLVCKRPPAPTTSAHPATDDRCRPTAQGGVLVMTFNPRVQMAECCHDPAGILGVKLTLEGCAPVAVLCAYNPPAGSPGNGRRRRTPASSSLLNKLQQFHRSLSSLFATVIMAGDWNMRLGGLCGRRTADPGSARLRTYQAFLASVGGMILHGSPGQPPAHLTSRSVTDNTARGATEVDGFIVACTPRAGSAAILGLLQQVSWDDIPDSMTHVPVSALLSLQPATDDVATAADPSAAICDPARRFPWSDSHHHAAAEPIAEAVAAAAAASAELSKNATYGMLVSGFQAVKDTVYAVPAPQPDPHGSATHPSERPRPRYVDGVTIRRHKRAADRAYHRAQRRLNKLNELIALGHKPHVDVLAEAQAAMDQRRAERTRASHEVRALHRRQRKYRAVMASDEMGRLLRRDPSAFFKRLAALLSANLSTLPNAAPPVPLPALVAHHGAGFRETRDVPSAVTSGKYDEDIPRAKDGSGNFIMAVVSWVLVYLCIFPADKQIAPYLTECCPGCMLCNTFKQQLEAAVHGDPLRPFPRWLPHLNTCRAAGVDGLIAEMLAFTRPVAHRFAWRMKVAKGIATILNTWLRQGVPTDFGFLDVLISAPSKPLRPGAEPPVDPAANTRPLSVAVLFSKVFELVLCSRCEHFRVDQNLVGPQQAAFMQFHSSEMQVLTLREVLLWRRALGLGTNVIFVDFKAAYDSVHHALLWFILRRMNFPEGFIRLLQGWLPLREGRIRSGKEVSEPFPIDKGLPQGGILSTLLWNLVIEVLSRRLARLLPGVSMSTPEGAAVAGLSARDLAIRLTHLLFADDLALMTSDDREAALAALRIVGEFGVDFGIAVNDGVGKTEAMHFAASVAAAEAYTATAVPLALSLSNGKALCVKWVLHYRYLGANLKLNLDAGSTLSQHLGKFKHAAERTFAQGSNTVMRLDVAAQLQLLNTLVMASVNYLLAVLPVPQTLADSVDATVISIGRRVLGVPRNFPRELVALEMPLAPFHAICTAHQVRLLHSLLLTPTPDCLASRIVRLQEACPEGPCPAGTRCHEDARGYVPFATRVRRDWAQLLIQRGRTEEQQAHHAISWTLPATLRDIKPQVAVARRSIAFQAARLALPKSGGASERLAAQNAITAVTPLPATPPRECLRVLLGGSLQAPLALLGELPDRTPMSMVGPGCSGALTALSKVNYTYTRAHMRLRAGRAAFAYEPWAQDDETDGDLRDRLVRYASAGRCPLCDPDGSRGTDDGPWHLFLDCTHEDVVQCRRDLCAAAPGIVQRLMDSVAEAQGRQTGKSPQLEARAAHLAALLAETSWSSADGRHVLLHLLTVLPWTAAIADGGLTPLSHWMGGVFDSATLTRRNLRRTATRAVSWANHWIERFADTRWNLLKLIKQLRAIASD